MRTFWGGKDIRWVSIFGAKEAANRSNISQEWEPDAATAQLIIQRLLGACISAQIAEPLGRSISTGCAGQTMAEPPVEIQAGLPDSSSPTANQMRCTLSSGSFRCMCQDCINEDRNWSGLAI